MGGAPNLVNSNGQEMTDDQKDYIESATYRDNSMDLAHPNRLRSVEDPNSDAHAIHQQMLRNWMMGGWKPEPINPGDSVGKMNAFAGVNSKAAAGSGQLGLFGAGKYIGTIQPLDVGPMASGVPYTVPPLPTLKPGRG